VIKCMRASGLHFSSLKPTTGAVLNIELGQCIVELVAAAPSCGCSASYWRDA
jgi:hypothetical protein